MTLAAFILESLLEGGGWMSTSCTGSTQFWPGYLSGAFMDLPSSDEDEQPIAQKGRNCSTWKSDGVWMQAAPVKGKDVALGEQMQHSVLSWQWGKPSRLGLTLPLLMLATHILIRSGTCHSPIVTSELFNGRQNYQPTPFCPLWCFKVMIWVSKEHFFLPPATKEVTAVSQRIYYSLYWLICAIGWFLDIQRVCASCISKASEIQ